MSGERVLGGLRRMQRLRDVPMVLYSDDEDQLGEAVTACRASGFIRKTQDAAALFHAVEAWLPG